MVKVELSYNPYLLETGIKFNGKKPRVNSHVEKYNKGILQNWINKIPDIFYDEMNGYDFDLEFSGTKLEYEYLKDSFINANVNEELVRLFHKNELDNRKVKVDKIDILLEWLNNNRNRKFDYDSFISFYDEFFSSDYSCIMVNGNIKSEELFNDHNVSMEYVSDVYELDHSDLYHIPVVMYVDNESLYNLKSNIHYFLNRKDIEQRQLFFIIASMLDISNIERTIKDLGINNPVIISHDSKQALQAYLEVYQVSDYIYDSIKIFNEYELRISEQLDKEKEESLIINKEIHENIDKLENDLFKLKESLDLFVNKDNINFISDLNNYKQSFIYYINNWKSRKIKLTSELDAVVYINDLQNIINKQYNCLFMDVYKYYCNTLNNIEIEYSSFYDKAETKIVYTPSIEYQDQYDKKELHDMTDQLLSLKHEEYVTVKEDFFGMLFKSSNDKVVEQVLQTTYNCNEMKDAILSIAINNIDDMIAYYEQSLQTSSNDLSNLYINHLNLLITDKQNTKTTVSKQLSEDEQILQNDIDWLNEYKEQLRVIERG